jgi:uncharacterized protein
MHDISTATVEPTLLAQAWTPQLLQAESGTPTPSGSTLDDSSALRVVIARAASRTLPLLTDASAVPFVCRYRVDLVNPLTTRQVHLLQTLSSRHASLQSVRAKVLRAAAVALDGKGNAENEAWISKVQTSTSKAELDDWYAPYKPPSKGSVLDRIQNDHPDLIPQLDAFWHGDQDSSSIHRILKQHPKDAVLHVLSTKLIANEPSVVETVQNELWKHAKIRTKPPASPSNDPAADQKYVVYHDFTAPLSRLRDHQILAIRRGVEQKLLQLSYEVDGSKIEACMRYAVRRRWPRHGDALPANLLDEAVHEAYTRTLRRKLLTRLWSKTCLPQAQARALQVFAENTSRALLAPPASRGGGSSGNNASSRASPPLYLLSVDPGFQAGLKCAVLDVNGHVALQPLTTVKYLGNARTTGVRTMSTLLRDVADATQSNTVVVTLGNGHGTHEARDLLREAAAVATEKLELDIQVVHEAGASVWSVTEAAREEFPNDPPSAIAAVSIGRRWQNPLHELIKVPPASLGLGMYQHDVPPADLDDVLHRTSVDAAAAVGVDVNTCRVEILRKVPGLAKLADAIMAARPLATRQDLLSRVTGLGPKTFQACAGFLRIVDGPEPLDGTLVHPESYDTARWLLRTLSWDLSTVPTNLPPRAEWKSCWKDVLNAGSTQFGVSPERVLSVLENLVDSLINVDPRLRQGNDTGSRRGASPRWDGSNCARLPAELAHDLAALQAACPVRNVQGTVRNLADFGAFVDFGGPQDGLLHISQMMANRVALDTLLIGQGIGIDIVSVQDHKVSLALAGGAVKNGASVLMPPRTGTGVRSRRTIQGPRITVPVGPKPTGGGKRSASTSKSVRPTNIGRNTKRTKRST